MMTRPEYGALVNRIRARPGFGIESKVALAASITTVAIGIGTAAGLHSADANTRLLFRTMGATRWQTPVRMTLPAGLPQILTGLRIASVGMMAGAITGAFPGGGKGFGARIRIAVTRLDTPRVFALILSPGVIGLSLFLPVSYLQRRVMFRHRERVLCGSDRACRSPPRRRRDSSPGPPFPRGCRRRTPGRWSG